MRHRRFPWIALLVAATAVVVVAWVRTPVRHRIHVPEATLDRLKPGDLVFRQGTEWVSDAVMAVDGHYSHVGMLVREHGHWSVIHAVPAERPQRTGAVVEDTLTFFMAPARAHAIGLYHVRADATERAAAVKFVRSRLGVPFGFGQGQTYCTKLVHAAWTHAGVNLDVTPTRLHVPLLDNTDYWMPSDLLASPRLEKRDQETTRDKVPEKSAR